MYLYKRLRYLARSLPTNIKCNLFNVFIGEEVLIIMNSDTATKKTKINNAEAKDEARKEINSSAATYNERIENAKDKISGNLSGAAEKLHKSSDKAQDFLKVKADRFNESAREKIEKAGQMGHRAASAIENSSDYVKNFDFAEAGSKIKQTVKQKPQIGIALAGIFGLLIGLLVGRKTS